MIKTVSYNGMAYLVRVVLRAENQSIDISYVDEAFAFPVMNVCNLSPIEFANTLASGFEDYQKLPTGE